MCLENAIISYIFAVKIFYCSVDAKIGMHAIKDNMQMEIQKRYFHLQSQLYCSITIFLEPRFREMLFSLIMWCSIYIQKIRDKINTGNIS